MPKISAPTVAEHRAAQRRALLAAAEAIVAEKGLAAVTPGSVGARAGLARSSFYEYFPSRDDLLAAVAVSAFEQWAAEVEAVTSAVPAGRARLHAYVEATIRLTADGKHALATGLQQAELSPTSRDAIMALHDTLVTPLVRLLEEAGAADVETQAALVQGVIGAGVQLVTHGAPAPAVTAAIIAMLDAGVRL
ncbi:MAG: TetR/AcrR family transcriptional regulator [Pseudolysinimonas sp.]